MSETTTEERMVCFRCDGELEARRRWGLALVVACLRCGWDDVRAVRIVSAPGSASLDRRPGQALDGAPGQAAAGEEGR